ncbi:class I adenylate-forming enzyme family protein [Streptomyces chiangmaiensis]|uniref:AMP-binding protein n=1 Tax=Streptomyces chiangmaiensis TaxID=766497 RepID=A0ABU7FPJ3_9ACTN|nr:AMP-binding protein [Streptomyces chiangmaiensis]MED7825874.1 AMP-binding protein [Streptomyces chiangmaiensis]
MSDLPDLSAQLRRHRNSGRTAVRCGNEAVSYRTLDAHADAWAAWLRERTRPGDRVATLCRSSIEQIALLYGCARAGRVLMPLSYRLRPQELAALIDDATPALLLHDEGHTDLAAGTLRRCVHQPVRLPLVLPRGAAAVSGDVDPGAAVLLIHTSGSSGRPRGVPLNHRMCVATGEALDGVAALVPEDVVVQLLPQYHVGGWTVLPLLALARGATLVVEPEFDADRALRQLAAATLTMAVPTMYRMMADSTAFGAVDLPSLRLAICGGAALPGQLARIWWERGVPLCQGYGLTEAGPNVLCVPPAGVEASAGWTGVPYPGVEVALAGVSAGPGTGELLVRGPGVFAGYWGGPPHQGWLHTGDLAERDARGWYRIVGRLDDGYVSGGENVAPAEVERALRAHPAVVDATVVGVPDERWGEVGVAFVVARSAVDGEGLRAWCRERLAGFKVPARVSVVESLPTTGLGKVRRDVLREMAREAI